jgi:hypothetical protein
MHTSCLIPRDMRHCPGNVLKAEEGVSPLLCYKHSWGAILLLVGTAGARKLVFWVRLGIS